MSEVFLDRQRFQGATVVVGSPRPFINLVLSLHLPSPLLRSPDRQGLFMFSCKGLEVHVTLLHPLTPSKFYILHVMVF